MKKYLSPEVVCPFYHQEDAKKLLCEGFCKDTSLQISFQRREQLILHKEMHCISFEGYPKCPLYSVIYKQYEVE